MTTATLAIAIVAMTIAATQTAAAQDREVLQTGRPVPSVPQVGRQPDAVPQTGVPQTGRVPQAVPQRNPDGSVPRVVRRWHPPVTVIYGNVGQDFIAYPNQFNLPSPAYGLVWRRIGNDAVLYDIGRGSILEVRGRWFG